MEQVYKKTGILFKLLPCLLATLIAFMTLYGSFVYAVDENFDVTFTSNIFNHDVYCIIPNELKSNYQYMFFDTYTELSGGSLKNVLYAYFSNSNFYISSSGNNYFLGTLDGSAFYRYYIVKDSNSDNYIYNLSNFTANGSSTFSTLNSGSSFSINNIYSNADIYDSSSGENVLFQAPPHQVEGIIAEQTQGVQMDKTLQEILGILPVVLVVIVGLIAIRKGIQFLMVRMKKV